MIAKFALLVNLIVLRSILGGLVLHFLHVVLQELPAQK
jgi:hypothetical protein